MIIEGDEGDDDWDRMINIEKKGRKLKKKTLKVWKDNKEKFRKGKEKIVKWKKENSRKGKEKIVKRKKENSII